MTATNQHDLALVTKVTQILQRDDGTEVKIIAESSYGRNLELQPPHTEVYRRESPNHLWRTCNTRPHPNWLSMSVDQYVKEGRSEMLQAVTIAEILKVSSLIGTPALA